MYAFKIKQKVGLKFAVTIVYNSISKSNGSLFSIWNTGYSVARKPSYTSQLCSVTVLGAWRVLQTWIGSKHHLTQENVGLSPRKRLKTELQESNLPESCYTATHWPGIFVIYHKD